MGARLDLVCHILLPENMLLLFICIVSFCFSRHFLNKLLIAVLTSVLVLEHCFLVQHSLHHFHTNGELLLVIVAGTWIFDSVLVQCSKARSIISNSLRHAPSVSRCLLLRSLNLGLILPWTDIDVILVNLGSSILLRNCLLSLDFQLCQLTIILYPTISRIVGLAPLRLPSYSLMMGC